MKRKNIINFIVCFVGFSLPFSVFCMFIYLSVVRGIVLGVAGGLFFAIGITLFTIVIGNKSEQALKDRFGENNILYSDGANLMVGLEAVGGWLGLLRDSLYFFPHKFNIAKAECVIHLNEVTEVGKGKRPRTIYIKKKTGETFLFVVNSPKEWIAQINLSIGEKRG